MKRTIYLLTCIFVPALVFGQKKFEVTFILPDSTIAKEIGFSHWDCNKKGWSRDTATIKGNKAIISHTYNTVNADIIAWRNVGDDSYSIEIYTTGQAATVTCTASADSGNPFSNMQLVNAKDYKKEEAVAEAYIKDAFDTYKQRFETVGSDPKLYNNPDEIEKLRALRTVFQKKRLQYIRDHSDSFFAFSWFTKEAMYELSPDYLLGEFKTLFPANLRDSEQGRSIKSYLLEREGLELKKKAPAFTVDDLDHKRVSLAEVYNKKTVLLVFWGTWCGPCVAEIPMLKEWRDKYPKDKFEIISVATTSPEEKVREMVKEKEMNWIHILNEDKINQQYHVKWYPTMFVINPKGDFAFSSPTMLDISIEKIKKAIDDSIAAMN
ncbi:TlpA family protein disulfide reductase [Chitinophaga silvisoli]|uniref:TlpA family protein disulfide reductase n=1 Tax=Chitinophaga silvisoli TaxID=2291814 RepID=A0A3E1NUZ2_9BACT|nr:TlpA disulfide reductase family protein [Chitinophaga silvisoli]RFM31578.1 TlpA family protein disulfide reductase [Chitinophaga silvisoli]